MTAYANPGPGSDPGEGFSSQDRAIARAVSLGKTYAEAGALVGLSETTVWRRMQDPDLRGLVDTFRDAFSDRILTRNLRAALASIDYLEKVRDDPEAADYLRVKAADSLLLSFARLGRFAPETVNPKITPEHARAIMLTAADEYRAELAAGDDDGTEP